MNKQLETDFTVSLYRRKWRLWWNIHKALLLRHVHLTRTLLPMYSQPTFENKLAGMFLDLEFPSCKIMFNTNLSLNHFHLASDLSTHHISNNNSYV